MSWPISEAAAHLLRTAHVAQPRAYWVDDELERHYLPVTGGVVTLDGGALIRSTCTLTLAAEADLWEQLVSFPYGTRIWVEYGIGSTDLHSPTEYVPFGKFIVEKVNRADPGATIELTGSDLFRMSQWDQFGWVRTVAAANYLASLTYLINYLSPNPANTYGSNPSVTGGVALFDPTRDRLAYIQDYASAMITTVWADREGMWSARPSDDDAGDPVWLIDASATGVMVGNTERRDSEQTRNVIYVKSEPTAVGALPLTVRVSDDDPASPTYYLGPFGSRSLVYPGGFVTDYTNMGRLGTAVLKSRLGLLRAVDVTLPPTPQLDPGDLVELLLPDSDLSELRTVVYVQVDLAGGLTQVRLDEHRVTAASVVVIEV